MRGTCHGASGQRAPQKTQMDAQKNRPLSPESLWERWQQQWQHFIAELTQLLQEPKVEFLWGDETAVYDNWIPPHGTSPRGTACGGLQPSANSIQETNPHRRDEC
jgi:hypothetical protein